MRIRLRFVDEFTMEFVRIKAGTFLMGGNRFGEKPVHEVVLTNDFFMGKYEVTQGQWETVMGENPSYFGGKDRPVERVSWDDVQEFIDKLNDKEGRKIYRLPTEAEWEYACRAGTTTEYFFGDDEDKLGEYVWYDDNSGNKTHPVGKKKPNPWGLYDMYGNVWEWCQDLYGDYPKGKIINPKGPDSGSYRVFRGGSWGHSAVSCRSANRSNWEPDYRYSLLGFRLVMEDI